jgi:hypothetical protein
MEVKLVNIDLVPQEMRSKFQDALNNALSPESKDEELSEYLRSLMNDHNEIDANIAFMSDLFNDFRLSYQESGIEYVDSQNNLAEDDFDFLSIVDAHEDLVKDLGSSSEFSNQENDPVLENESSELSLFKAIGEDIDSQVHLEDANLKSDPFGYSPLIPEIEFDADALRTFESEVNEPDVSLQSIPSPEVQITEPSLQTSSKPNLDPQHAQIIETVPSAVGNVPQNEEVAPSFSHGGAHRDANLVEGAAYLATNAMKLGGSLLKGATSLIDGAGSAVKLAIEAGKAAGPAAKTTALSLSQKLEALKSGKSSNPISSTLREDLTGLPNGTNVVDIRSRMNNAIQRIDPDSLRNSIARIADNKLKGKRNTLASLMRGVEEGYPQGRISSLTVADGFNLGEALNSVINGSKTEQIMAKALINANLDLPDAHSEMEFIGDQYLRISDAIDSLATQGESLGMTQEEISSQFIEPVQDWISKRAEEDSMIMNLSKVQSEKPGSEITPEESEERRKKFKEIADQLAKLIANLFNRGNEKQQSESTTMSISR